MSPRREAVRTLDPRTSEWPQALTEMSSLSPPDLLFAAGVSLPPAPMIAVVGTRRPTGAGVEAAREIASGIAEAGFVVVSGLAVGIDTAAHQAALAAGAPTVAVLGCGLDVDYPAANAPLKQAILGRGTVVTEYPLGTKPARWHFPERNRIIAGLCLGVVVVEGGPKSGALVTARHALDANRNVYAVPGSIRNPMARGPNELIRTARATLVSEVGHIFEDLAPSLAARPHVASRAGNEVCDGVELRVLDALDDSELSADALLAQLELKAGRLAIVLSRLELRGFVQRGSAGYVISSSGARARGAVVR
jgi:DNA processing protein